MGIIDRELAEWRRNNALPGLWTDWQPQVFGDFVQPALDLEETDTEFVLRADVPGVEKDDIHIRPRSQGIEIRARKEAGVAEEEEGLYRHEREKRSFYRYCALGEEADVGNAKAKLKNGVLEITVPKIPEISDKRKEIKVRS